MSVEEAPPFVVFALPRSRTYWCSRYLSYGGWHCGHDEAAHLRSEADVRSWLAQPATGTVETAAAPFWRLLRHYRPDARVAVIRRPVDEVLASCMATAPFDATTLHRSLRRLDAKLDQITHRWPNALSISYAELATEEGCAALFEHCLPHRHDPDWWRLLAPLNLQTDMVAMLRYCQAHGPQLLKMAKVAKHRIMAAMATDVSRETIEGVTFACEPFSWETFREAIPLFREHLVQTDQSPDDYLAKNLPLFDALAKHGALHCMTARSNGRLFGYLVSVVGPSLDSPDRIEAQHTIFFAHPAIRNLGMQLQRAAAETLRERGVTDLYMRASVRGVGPRLGSFYRRLGARPFGELYHLELAEAA